MSIFRRKIMDPILALLKQGITPEKLALSIACGIVVGVFPVLGTTTVLCTLAAILLGLNLPAIQLVNWVVYPAQLILLIPFYRLGEILFGVEPLALAPAQLIAMFRSDFWASIAALWDTTLRAIVAWALIGVPSILLLRWMLIPILGKMRIS